MIIGGDESDHVSQTPCFRREGHWAPSGIRLVGVPPEWDSFRPDYVGVARSVANTKQGRLNTPTDAWRSLTHAVVTMGAAGFMSQCTCRCVVLPDLEIGDRSVSASGSQCTCRCVVLPDMPTRGSSSGLIPSQCTYRCVVLPDCGCATGNHPQPCLNAPTGAWCSLTCCTPLQLAWRILSQCTYRCVVLPDSA